MVVRKIVRNGNSLCVNIPSDYLRFLQVSKGDEVIIAVGASDLSIMKHGKSDGKRSGKEIDKNG